MRCPKLYSKIFISVVCQIKQKKMSKSNYYNVESVKPRLSYLSNIVSNKIKKAIWNQKLTRNQNCYVCNLGTYFKSWTNFSKAQIYFADKSTPIIQHNTTRNKINWSINYSIHTLTPFHPVKTKENEIIYIQIEYFN